MAGILVPYMRDYDNHQRGVERWRRGGLVQNSGRTQLMWDGRVDTSRTYRRAWAYTEYDGQPLFCAEQEDGLVVRFGEITYPAGEELYGPPGIVAEQVFYLSRFQEGWELAWNGYGRPMHGQRLHFTTLEIMPYADGQGFDALYLSDADGGAIAVFNDQESRTFSTISLCAVYQTSLLVCGMHGGRWYVDYYIGDHPNCAAENQMFDLQFDTTTGELSYRKSLLTKEREVLELAA